MIPNDFIYPCLFYHGDFVNYDLISLRDHPFKTSACLGGRGVPMCRCLPIGGVLGLPTSAIFEIIREKLQFIIDYMIKINNDNFLIIHQQKELHF